MQSLGEAMRPLMDRYPAPVPTERPADCWCGGNGGKWGYVPLPVDDDGQRLGVIPDDLEDPPMAFREWCSCPEAEAAKVAAERYRERVRRYWHDRRVRTKLATFWHDEAVPPRYQHATLDWFAASHPNPDWAARAVVRVRRWLETPNRWLILWGPPGHGKTALAIALLHEFAMAEQTVLFKSAPELFGRIKSTYNKNSTFSEQDITDALVGVDALFLDDLGTEKASEAWLEATLFDLFNRRYNRNARTIITTNLSAPALMERVGDRSANRIREMAKGATILIEHTDLRAL